MRHVAVVAFAALCRVSIAFAQTPATYGTADRPLVSIGVEDGADAYLLSGVVDALRQADGTLVVANCGSNELRFYDGRGSHIRTTGRRGRGPGEFQYLRRIFPAGGDSIGVYDGTPQRRLSVFSPTGVFARSVQLTFSAEPVGRTADGHFVIIQPENYRTPRPVLAPGFHRRNTTIYRMDATGTLVDSLTGLPGSEVFIVDNAAVRERAPRFRRIAVTAIFPDRIVFGAQDQPSFTEFSADLRSRQERPTLTRPLPVTAELRRQWDETRSVLAARGGVLPVYAEEYAPATPAYRDLVAGTDGRVWVQDPELPGTYPLIWTAYQNGRPTARVELPVRFFPFQFGPDWVLGVHYDDMGIERVQVFSFVPRAPSGRKLSPQEAAPPNTPGCGSWTSR